MVQARALEAYASQPDEDRDERQAIDQEGRFRLDRGRAATHRRKCQLSFRCLVDRNFSWGKMESDTCMQAGRRRGTVNADVSKRLSLPVYLLSVTLLAPSVSLDLCTSLCLQIYKFFIFDLPTSIKVPLPQPPCW